MSAANTAIQPIEPVVENPRILLAEDDADASMVMRKLLQRAGYLNIESVHSGPEALQAVRVQPPDILISDISMPGELDGIEAARLITREFRIPVIFISAYSDPATLARAKTVPPAAYLVKPFRIEDVRISVEMALYRAQLEKDLSRARQNNRELAHALEHARDAILLTDMPADTDKETEPSQANATFPTILHTNTAFKTLTGHTLPDVTIAQASAAQGNPTALTLSVLNGQGTDTAALINMLQKAKAGEPASCETTQYTKEGKAFTALWDASPAPPGRLVLVLRDITQMRVAQEAESQRQRIEALGRFTGGVAHDFNSLLGIVNAYADLIETKLGETHDCAKYVNNIRTAGRRGSDLVAQLLTFARSQTIAAEDLNVIPVAEELHLLLRRIIRPEIEITLDMPSTLPTVQINRSQFEQMLMNLCLNARDAIEGPGTISIEIDSVQYADDAGAHNLSRGSYLRLQVTDTGSGMTPEVCEHLFEPFFTTKDVGKGTGLGLATVHGITEQLGGRVTAESTLEKGSTFKVWLPV